MIKENVITLKKDIGATTLLAATKSQSVEKIKEAIDAGITIIGENYVQEAETKHTRVKQHSPKTQIHLIGHLQSNKVRRAVKIFDMIQSVDSIKLAQKLNNECQNQMKVLPILIEVNIAKEENKSGCSPEELPLLAEMISQLPNLKLEGLMTMAPVSHFKIMKQLFDIMKKRYHFSILSMGMSDSYKAAIQQGSTMIRIGTKIFGPR